MFEIVINEIDVNNYIQTNGLIIIYMLTLDKIYNKFGLTDQKIC